MNHFEFHAISTVFQQFLKLHSHISVLWRFCRISVISGFLFLGIGLKTKTQKSRKIFIFGFIKFKWIWTCFLITILIFWVLKLKYTKNKFHLINLNWLEALKGQARGTWLGIWLNHIDIYVFWRIFQLFLKLHFHISVLWRFCRISVISGFSFLGIRPKTKVRKSRKIFIFGPIKHKWMWICFWSLF